jgi:zinc transport system substrate-binding protein
MMNLLKRKISIPFQQISIPLGVGVTWICLVCFLTGCNRQGLNRSAGSQQTAQPLTHRVVAVSYPLQYLTQRITGDAIEVSFPVPARADPQSWRPARASISQMQTADLIIANGTGASYAKWLTTVTLPESKMRYTASRGLALADYIAVQDIHVVHSHGPEGEHSHSTMVARTWLDPAIAKKQAIFIAAELKSVYPELAGEFESNLQLLTHDLEQLSELMKTIRPGVPKVVLTANPRLKFFTRAAGVEDRHLDWFEAPIRDKAESDLEKALAGGGPRPGLILFAEKGPSVEMLELLSVNNLQAKSVSLIDRKPASGDFISALRENIQELSRALE